jgi:hypothetical protein
MMTINDTGKERACKFIDTCNNLKTEIIINETVLYNSFKSILEAVHGFLFTVIIPQWNIPAATVPNLHNFKTILAAV